MGTWPAIQACALNGNELRPSGSQAGIQSTEPHQPMQRLLGEEVLNFDLVKFIDVIYFILCLLHFVFLEIF